MTPTKARPGKRKFVKYNNRKLHEEGSQVPYVSMSDVAHVIAAGADIEVVDDATGEDLTIVTLARIAYDSCRRGAWKEAQAVHAALGEVLGSARAA